VKLNGFVEFLLDKNVDGSEIEEIIFVDSVDF